MQNTLSTVSFVKRELYGGALTCRIPKLWRDVSLVRQVPDHQEVYQDCSVDSPAGGGTGSCLVFEILERQNDVSNDKACSFFFNDLADSNAAPSEENDGRLLIKECVYSLASDSASEGSSKRKLDNGNKEDEMVICLGKNFRGVPNGISCFCLGKQMVTGAGVRQGDPRAINLRQWVKVQMCILRLENVQTDMIISLTTPEVESADAMSLKSSLTKGKQQPTFTTTFKDIVSSFKVEDWSLFA